MVLLHYCITVHVQVTSFKRDDTYPYLENGSLLSCFQALGNSGYKPTLLAKFIVDDLHFRARLYLAI